MTYVPSIRASQGALKYTTSNITFDTSTAVGFETFDKNVVSCKNISITPPKGEADMVHLIGQETTAIGAGVPVTGTFQNAVYDQKAWSDAKMTCTLVFSSDETNIPDFIEVVTGAGVSINSAAYRRHTFGDSTSAQVRVTTGAILLGWDNGSEVSYAVLNNPIVNMGDIKPTGMDGHFEMDIEAKALPKNFVLDVKQ